MPPEADRSGFKVVKAPHPLGLMLKRLRQRRGFSLAHVADELGVSKVSVWAWENGKCLPQPERIAGIVSLLGAQSEDLSEALPGSNDASGVIEDCRRRIAGAFDTDNRSVRIIIEL